LSKHETGEKRMKKQEALEILERNKASLKEFHVSSLSLFGSVARDEAAPGSDIDILVEFDKDARVGLFELVRLRKFLSES
jgi:predicted nucleotidyltransferase